MASQCSVFISYRRTDAAGYVRALMSDLRNSFGGGQVFLDMEAIAPGHDFNRVIDQAVGGCGVLLAVIGPGWLAANAQSRSRIHDPDDFIHLEIASALKRHIPVIPVLLDKTPMPKQEDLPLDLQTLVSLQAVSMSHEHWDDDMQKLLAAISKLTIAPQLARQYANAKLQLQQGYWQDALAEFDSLQSAQANYENSHDLAEPLRQLQQQLAATGPDAHPWQRLALNYPLPLVALASLVPHMLAAAFNYLFNWQAIVQPMQLRGVKHAEKIFSLFAININTLFFILGLVLLALLLRPISKCLQAMANGTSVTPAQLVSVRKHCLHLGHLIAVIGLAMWIVAGPIYPLLIKALDASGYIAFIASLAISGLAVAAYPFLLVTWLCTHVFYRPLLVSGTVSECDREWLEQVGSRKWLYLLLAGALPMLVISLGFILVPLKAATQPITTLLGIVGLVGFAGFLLALLLFKAIQHDLELLHQLLWVSSPKQTVHWMGRK